MGIREYLSEELVLQLDAHTQTEVLYALTELLEHKGKLVDKEAFYQAILEREKIVSTGIGIGVAIPHAKLPGYDEFFIAIGLQKEEGIEWKSLDDLPVHIIFMIGGPEDQQTEYLRILSMITTAIKDEARRKALLEAKSGADVVAIFEDL